MTSSVLTRFESWLTFQDATFASGDKHSEKQSHCGLFESNYCINGQNTWKARECKLRMYDVRLRNADLEMMGKNCAIIC